MSKSVTKKKRELSGFIRSARGEVDSFTVTFIIGIIIALAAYFYSHNKDSAALTVGHELVAAVYREVSKFEGKPFEEAVIETQNTPPVPEGNCRITVMTEDAGLDVGQVTVIATTEDGSATYRFSFLLPKKTVCKSGNNQAN